MGYKDFNPLKNDFFNSLLLPYDNYFCNPPFSNIEPFVDYMIKCNQSGFNCVMLLPVRMCTRWFQKLVFYGVKVVFITNRLKYGNSSTSAPFDSMLVFLDQCRDLLFSWSSTKDIEFDSIKYIQTSIFDFI